MSRMRDGRERQPDDQILRLQAHDAISRRTQDQINRLAAYFFIDVGGVAKVHAINRKRRAFLLGARFASAPQGVAKPRAFLIETDEPAAAKALTASPKTENSAETTA